MSENPVPAPEGLNNPEKIQFREGMVALQSRLLLGGAALDPKKQDIPDLTAEQLAQSTQSQEATLLQLNKASNIERQDYWEKRNVQGFENQKRVWIEETMADFQNSQEYFKQAGMDKSFARLSITTQTFNQAYIERFYNTFFSKDDKKTHIDDFYVQICKPYVKNITVEGKEVSKIDYELLKQDLPAIQWLAGIFGENSSEVFTQLVDAVGKTNNPEEREKLIAQANEKTASGKSRHNDPDTEEVKLLNFLLTGKTGDRKTSPSPQPEPKPTPNPEPVPKPKKEPENITETDAYKIAEALLDYDTGKPKDVKIDLSKTFPPFVNKVKQRMETDSTLFPPGGMPLVLSDLSYAMIDKIADSANKKNKKLRFNLQGILLTTGNGANHKNSMVASFASPSVDFQAAQADGTYTSSDIGKNNAILLSKNTNLTDYFQIMEKNPAGNNVADMHIHYDALGERYSSNPSDNQDIPKIMKENDFKQYIWGVATKSGEELLIKIWLSKRHSDDTITHEELPLVLSSQLEDKKSESTPNIDPAENLKAAQQFISVVRDPSKYHDNPDYIGFAQHEIGFRVVKPIETGYGGASSWTECFGNRYKMPVGLYIEANHAMLILKPPYQESGQWKIKVYNPFHAGEEERVLPKYNPDDPLSYYDPDNTSAKFDINNQAITLIQQNKYNLTISEKPELQPYFDTFMRGKLATLQKDSYNCVPYCHFVAALLNALEPGDTDFKREGIEQFRKDFDIKIRTREEILPNSNV